MPDTNPMPFPDCSVVTHSNVVMTPSTLTFDISESEDSGSVCDDPFFLKEVMTFLDYFKREYIYCVVTLVIPFLKEPPRSHI